MTKKTATKLAARERQALHGGKYAAHRRIVEGSAPTAQNAAPVRPPPIDPAVEALLDAVRPVFLPRMRSPNLLGVTAEKTLQMWAESAVRRRRLPDGLSGLNDSFANRQVQDLFMKLNRIDMDTVWDALASIGKPPKRVAPKLVAQMPNPQGGERAWAYVDDDLNIVKQFFVTPMGIATISLEITMLIGDALTDDELQEVEDEMRKRYPKSEFAWPAHTIRRYGPSPVARP